jgi:hypothetical protein
MRKLTVAFIMFALTANAEMTIKDYQQMMASSNKDQIDMAKLYIAGLGQGMTWANAEARIRKMPFFCAPENLGLNSDNYKAIIEKSIELAVAGGAAANKEKFDNTAIGMVLMQGLLITFPCGK